MQLAIDTKYSMANIFHTNKFVQKLMKEGVCVCVCVCGGGGGGGGGGGERGEALHIPRKQV